MKIVFFSDTYPPRTNGVANVVFQQARALARLGHEVLVFTISNQTKKFLNDADKNFTVFTLPSTRTPIYSGERLTLPMGLSLRFLKKFQPDIIHSHTPFAVGWEAVLAAKFLKIPLVGTHHTFYDLYLKHIKLDFGWAKKFSWKYTALYYNRCDLVLNPSQALVDAMQNGGLKIPADVLRNFIDTELFRPVSDDKTKNELKKKFGIGGHQSIVYMGRISYEKNIDQAIKAFALTFKKSPDLTFLIIGEGPEKRNLRQLVKKISLEKNIIFTGLLRGQNLVNALQANDIFITASRSENMPLSVVEAMAAGLPVIAVAEKGLKELIIDGHNGFLVEAGKPQKIADKILELLNQPELMDKFGAASREMTLEYSEKKITERLISFYKRLLR